MPKTRPPYDTEFRQHIRELLHSERTLNSLAEEFGCTEQSIRNWQCQGSREVRVLREERDILKKAATWFAQDCYQGVFGFTALL